LLDLFAESQEPFMARAWKRRREDKDKAAEAGAAKHKPFSKIDLTSIILDKGLLTKAAVMRYAQDHGTAAMQVYVHQQQRRLTEHLQDAMEWAAAREVAATERESDWQLLCRTADGDCAHGDGCGYAAAAQEAFRSNQSAVPGGAGMCPTGCHHEWPVKDDAHTADSRGHEHWEDYAGIAV
jgi:hypothetical protein